MADVDPGRRAADDGYDRYYAEKLWSWIPEVYRDADFTAREPNVLRALVEVIAGDAAVARRGIDRLWENVFIDYADSWAVSYIGDLLGARLLGSINGRGVRVDVGRTLFYRRRAGTMVVLEELIKDITGWGGMAVEAFRRLGRDWHGLDDAPFSPEGPHSGTPAGGFANLRARHNCDRLDTAFDRFAHRPDFRRLAGRRGRYAIPRLNIHLYRQKPIELRDSMGLKLAPNWFSFDPSGRETALFANNGRAATGSWEPAEIWHMPAAITASLLDHALFRIDPLTSLAGMGPRLPSLVGATIEGVRQFAELARLDVGGPPAYPAPAAFRAIQAATRVERCGKYQLYGRALEVATGASFGGTVDQPPEGVAAAHLAWQTPVPVFPTGVDVLIDPARGLARTDGQGFFFPRTYHYGQFDPVGAGGYDRGRAIPTGAAVLPSAQTSLDPIAVPVASLTGFDEFPASKSYQIQGQVAPFKQLVWQARNFTRPYVLLTRAAGAPSRAVLAAAPLDGSKPVDDPANLRTIEIDGLWLNVEQASYPEQVLLAPDQAAAPVVTTLVLDGTVAPIARVTLRNVTLDPGGERARLLPCRAVAIPYVRLLIRGEVRELVIERSIVGPIEEFQAADDPCSAGKVRIVDSIVQSIDPAQPAILLRSGALEITRSTVFGSIDVNRLEASELLVTGNVVAADNQHGCFRFSAAPAGPALRLPRQYESHVLQDGIPPHVFESQRFGQPGFAQLSATAPAAVQTGAETGSEIGAFSRVLAPILAADLRTKLDEYMPLNTISGLVYES
ncbi:MAG: hypothetical protein JOZ90_04220 [Alphaproteobacteria bacterium]|nr:hypothetical protein [Alphaproteobacteria bacterium]MBV9373198.1 hypothetical protein [Alphaproteobacteria bacterium]MBV9900287.1 hypothetical protein [Alphaproteobacteria bacterium]